MGNVAIGEDDGVDVTAADQIRQTFFRYNRDTGGIVWSGQCGGITAIRNAGNLRGGECNNLIGRIVTIHNVEIVKIPPCRTHNPAARVCAGAR
mgnify:CR=1 FL=1